MKLREALSSIQAFASSKDPTPRRWPDAYSGSFCFTVRSLHEGPIKRSLHGIIQNFMASSRTSRFQSVSADERALFWRGLACEVQIAGSEFGYSGNGHQVSSRALRAFGLSVSVLDCLERLWMSVCKALFSWGLVLLSMGPRTSWKAK